MTDTASVALRVAALCMLGLLGSGCGGGLGPDGVLRIDEQHTSLVSPMGGCHEAFLKPLTSSVCGDVEADPAQALVAQPIRMGASRSFAFKADSIRFQAIQISLITDLQKDPFKVVWTHTYDGNKFVEDLSDLAPGIYVAEVLAISTSERRNAFYRFAIEVTSSTAVGEPQSVPGPASTLPPPASP